MNDDALASPCTVLDYVHAWQPCRCGYDRIHSRPVESSALEASDRDKRPAKMQRKSQAAHGAPRAGVVEFHASMSLDRPASSFLDLFDAPTVATPPAHSRETDHERVTLAEVLAHRHRVWSSVREVRVHFWLVYTLREHELVASPHCLRCFVHAELDDRDACAARDVRM